MESFQITVIVILSVVLLLLMCLSGFALYRYLGQDEPVSCDCGTDIPTKNELLSILSDFTSRNYRSQREIKPKVAGVKATQHVYFNPYTVAPGKF